MPDTRFLQGMEHLVSGKAFNSGDVPAFILDGECEAREDAFAVDQNRTGTATALVAALLRAGQVQMIAECVEKAHAGIERDVVHGPVDAEGHRYGRSRRNCLCVYWQAPRDWQLCHSWAASSIRDGSRCEASS